MVCRPGVACGPAWCAAGAGGACGPAWSATGAEAGFVGGLEGLVFGLLVFVVGALLVAHAWAVVDTKAAVTDAARQAARQFVEAPDAATAGVEAQGAADAVIAGSGRDPSRASVALVSGSWGRCDRITISVSYPSAAVILPWVGRVGSAGRVVARHSELVDPYRSGLPGAAVCP